MDRAYTVREIDELREALENKYLFGVYSFDGVPMSSVPELGVAEHRVRLSRSFKEDEMRKTVEEMVRTHMLAGHTAEDLKKSETT